MGLARLRAGTERLGVFPAEALPPLIGLLGVVTLPPAFFSRPLM